MDIIDKKLSVDTEVAHHLGIPRKKRKISISKNFLYALAGVIGIGTGVFGYYSLTALDSLSSEKTVEKVAKEKSSATTETLKPKDIKNKITKEKLPAQDYNNNSIMNTETLEDKEESINAPLFETMLLQYAPEEFIKNEEK